MPDAAVKPHTGKILSPSRRWALRNPERQAALNREWRLRNKEHVREYTKTYRKSYRATKARKEAHNRSTVASRRQVQFGISGSDFEVMLISQDGKCAICLRRSESMHNGRVIQLCVDHDHNTGKIRGLLCRSCNMAIGNFKDDPVRLTNAIAYLVKHGR